MKLDEDEMEGLGWGAADKPDAFLTAGVEETGDFSEANLGNPGFDLGHRGAAGGEDDPCLLAGDPAGLDPGQASLPGIGVDAEFQPAGRKFGAKSAYGYSQPQACGGVVVLGQNFPSTVQAGCPGRQVGAEQEQVSLPHPAGQTAKQRKRIEVGKNAEEGEQLVGGRREVKGGKRTGKINSPESLFAGRQALGGATGKGEVGVGSQ